MDAVVSEGTAAVGSGLVTVTVVVSAMVVASLAEEIKSGRLDSVDSYDSYRACPQDLARLLRDRNDCRVEIELGSLSPPFSPCPAPTLDQSPLD